MLCPLTSILFLEVPQLGSIKFSKSHCLSVWSHRSNLKIDGSHHATTAFDKIHDRNNIPWGACVNSSQDTGLEPNCKLEWIRAPHLDFDHVDQLEGNDGVAFLVAIR
jgi:hypothetical protein